jgi:hypothetical protein
MRPNAVRPASRILSQRGKGQNRQDEAQEFHRQTAIEGWSTASMNSPRIEPI